MLIVVRLIKRMRATKQLYNGLQGVLPVHKVDLEDMPALLEPHCACSCSGETG